MSSHTVLQTRAQKLIAGTQKRFATTASLLVGNVTYTPVALVGLLQGLLDALTTVATAKAAWTTALKALVDTKGQMGPVLRAYTNFLYGTYGNAADPLADFGLTPRKAKKQKIVAKAAAIELSLATKKARNVMGKVQRKSVKGTANPAATPATTTGAAPSTGTATPAKSTA
jgi:hypothetical protein